MGNKTNLLILLVFTFIQNLNAQESKYAIGACFATEQPYAKYGDNPQFALGYTTGINALIKLNKHFEFATGLLYSQKITTSDISYKNWEWPVPSPLPLRTKSVFNTNYLGIPVKIYFVAGNHKLKFISSIEFTLGFWINTVVKENTNYADGTNNSNETTYFNSYYFANNLLISPTASMGLQYDLNNKIFLRLESTYTILPTYTDYSTFTSFGLNFSVFRKF